MLDNNIMTRRRNRDKYFTRYFTMKEINEYEMKIMKIVERIKNEPDYHNKIMLWSDVSFQSDGLQMMIYDSLYASGVELCDYNIFN